MSRPAEPGEPAYHRTGDGIPGEPRVVFGRLTLRNVGVTAVLPFNTHFDPSVNTSSEKSDQWHVLTSRMCFCPINVRFLFLVVRCGFESIVDEKST